MHKDIQQICEAYDKVQGSSVHELADKLITVAGILKNKPNIVNEFGHDKIGDYIIELGQKVKSL